MDEAINSDNMLQAYIESLESQIFLKRELLNQIRNVISDISEATVSNGDWKELLKKPLFRPERSDPIGLSLASVSQTTRQESTKMWIEGQEDRLIELEDMLKEQKDANNDLTVLIDLLNRKLETMVQVDDRKKPKTPEELNHQLLTALTSFVENVLSVDLLDAEEAGNDVSQEVLALIMRLLNHDESLEVADFHGCSKKLFRLLLRSNLITVVRSPNNVRHVRLLDFTSYDLS